VTRSVFAASAELPAPAAFSDRVAGCSDVAVLIINAPAFAAGAQTRGASDDERMARHAAVAAVRRAKAPARKPAERMVYKETAKKYAGCGWKRLCAGSLPVSEASPSVADACGTMIVIRTTVDRPCEAHIFSPHARKCEKVCRMRVHADMPASPSVAPFPVQQA
jgi:hypothetical protein